MSVRIMFTCPVCGTASSYSLVDAQQRLLEMLPRDWLAVTESEGYANFYCSPACVIEGQSSKLRAVPVTHYVTGPALQRAQDAASEKLISLTPHFSSGRPKRVRFPTIAEALDAVGRKRSGWRQGKHDA